MSGHTAGKWCTDGGNTVMSKDSDQLNNGYAVCETHGPDKNYNAVLIAAAPDLLEALENLMAAYAEADQRICCNGIHCGCMGATTYQQAEHYANAALAKAKGQ